MSKQTLKQIKSAHSLTNKTIAKYCGVSEETVKSWLWRKGTTVPENMVRLLNLEVATNVLASRGFKLPWQLSDASRKHILVFACEKCGKLKRFVEDI